MIISKLASNNNAAAGAALIATGAAVVLAGHLIAGVLNEPDDLATDVPGVLPAGQRPPY